MRTRLDLDLHGEAICAAMWAMLRHQPACQEKRGARSVRVRRTAIAQLSMALSDGPTGGHFISARMHEAMVVAQFRISADGNAVETVYLAREADWMPALQLGIEMLRAAAGPAVEASLQFGAGRSSNGPHSGHDIVRRT